MNLIYRLIFPSKFGHFQLPVSLCFMVCFLQYFFPFSNVLSFLSSTPVRDGSVLLLKPLQLCLPRVYRTGPGLCLWMVAPMPLLRSAPCSVGSPGLSASVEIPFKPAKASRGRERVPSSHKTSGLMGERIL